LEDNNIKEETYRIIYDAISSNREYVSEEAKLLSIVDLGKTIEIVGHLPIPCLVNVTHLNTEDSISMDLVGDLGVNNGF